LYNKKIYGIVISNRSVQAISIAIHTMPYYYSPFRKDYQPPQQTDTPKPCPLCGKGIENQLLRDYHGVPIANDYYFWVANWYPRAEAHTMIVPRRHIIDFQEETEAEILARQALFIRVYDILKKIFPESGIEYFLQSGKGSHGTLAHLHWHVIPTLPQHSLTGFEKIGYFSTTEPAEEKVVITPIQITIAREVLIEKVQHATT